MQPEAHPHPTLGQKIGHSLSNHWLFILIASAGVLFSFFLWYVFLMKDNQNLARIVQIQSEHVAKDIEMQFAVRISVLNNMAKHLHRGTGSIENNWQDITEYLHDYGGFAAFTLYDKNFQVATDVQQPENPLMNGFIRHYTEEIKEMAAKNGIWLSPPLNLSSKEKGVLVVFPLNGSSMFFATLINFSQALDVHLDPREYNTLVFYNGVQVYNEGISTVITKYSLSEAFTSYGRLWQTTVIPTEKLISYIRTNLPLWVLLTGIIISILFSLVAYLDELTREQNKVLRQTNEDLGREIIERKQAEASQQKLEKDLQQGQKLQAIGTLAGGIAHDFNNILYAINGYTEMAQEDSPADSITHQNLGKVLEASKRGQELISRILTFSRRQKNEFKPISLKQTLDSVFSLLKPTIPASVSLEMEYLLPEKFMIMGDLTRIHQVVINIVNNAVDAMDGEGHVLIRCSLVTDNQELLHLAERVPGNYCKIEISDTGHGMDASTQKRIFEPFFTTKEVGKGTGLGLATVHTIMNEHKGDILVRSQLGHGTTFVILFPEYKPA